MARADYRIESMHTDALQMTDGEWDWLAAFEKKLRPEDRRELVAAHGNEYLAIVQSVTTSEKAYRVTGEKEEPLVLYGTYADENLPGRLIWCMATTGLKPYRREFARRSKQILEAWAEEHGILWNAVGEWNEPAKRWLKWCGAEFGAPLEMGGETFIRFYIRRHE